MPKMIVSDYDKTFYLNDKDIEKNKLLVNQFREKDNIFVIATGRSYLDFQEEVDKYNLKYDYALINHGSTIINRNNEVLCNFLITNDIIKDIKKDLELAKTKFYFCCSKLESRVNFEHLDLTKIAIVYNNDINIKKISNKINNKYQEVISYIINDNMLEIISKDINKSKSIKLLSNYLKINKKNIYTIGDGYSDINMIKDYNGYAMENSVVELKNVAKKEYSCVSEMIMELLDNEI